MTLSVDFVRQDDDLVMILPVQHALGERTFERWGFEEVVRELEKLAESAAEGDRQALKVYQRLVWSLRSRKAPAPSDPPRLHAGDQPRVCSGSTPLEDGHAR